MKKLFISIFTAVFALFALGTSTFAWFSMNDSVSASGMAIKVQSNSIFLQIINEDGAFKDDEAQLSAVAKYAEKTLQPVTIAKSYTAPAGENPEAKEAFDGSSMVFLNASSIDPAISDKNGSYTVVSEKAYPNNETTGNVFTLINRFQVRLNPTAGVHQALNLQVTELKIEAAEDATEDQKALLPAVRVLFICGETPEDLAGEATLKKDLWSNTSGTPTRVVLSSNAGGILAATVTDQQPGYQYVRVFIYIDGDDAATTTNNATKVDTSAYNISFKLSVNQE